MDPELTKVRCEFCGRTLTDLNATAHPKCAKAVVKFNKRNRIPLASIWTKSRLLGIIRQTEAVTDMCWRHADGLEWVIMELLAKWFDLDPENREEKYKIHEIFYGFFHDQPTASWNAYLNKNAVGLASLKDRFACQAALDTISQNMQSGAKSVLLSSLARVAYKNPCYTNLGNVAAFYDEHAAFVQEFKLRLSDISPQPRRRNRLLPTLVRWIRGRF